MFQFHCWNNSFRTFFYLKSNCLPEYGPRFFWCRSATDGARPGWDMGSATGSLGPPPPPWWEGDSLELLLNPPTCLCCWSTAIILASWDDITKNKNNHWRGGSKKQKQNKTRREKCVCVCVYTCWGSVCWRVFGVNFLWFCSSCCCCCCCCGCCCCWRRSWQAWMDIKKDAKGREIAT